MADTYTYPDGSKSYRRPNDGEVFKEHDSRTGVDHEWVWDDFLEQWCHRNKPQASGKYTSIYSTNPMDLDNLDEYEKAYSPDSWSDKEEAKTPVKENKCDCGSAAVGSSVHSKWCSLA